MRVEFPHLPTVRNRLARGFTLIEMIVAISILALVAILGWRGLDSIVRTRMALTADLEKTRGMQLTFAQLQSDCAQIAPATLIGTRPALMATPDRLLMIRLVFAEQQPTRLQVVGYRLRNGVLTRLESLATRNLTTLDAIWQAAVNDVDSGPNAMQAVALQNDVATMQIRVWDQYDQIWRSANSATASTASVGTANLSGLEMALRLRGRDGRVVKTFFLGAA